MAFNTNATYNWVYALDPHMLGVEDSIPNPALLLSCCYGDGLYYGDAGTSGQTLLQRRTTWWALASGARGVNNTSWPITSSECRAGMGWGVGIAVAALTIRPYRYLDSLINCLRCHTSAYFTVPDTTGGN